MNGANKKAARKIDAKVPALEAKDILQDNISCTASVVHGVWPIHLCHAVSSYLSIIFDDVSV